MFSVCTVMMYEDEQPEKKKSHFVALQQRGETPRKPPPDPLQPPESPSSTPPGHQEGARRSHAC